MVSPLPKSPLRAPPPASPLVATPGRRHSGKDWGRDTSPGPHGTLSCPGGVAGSPLPSALPSLCGQRRPRPPQRPCADTSRGRGTTAGCRAVPSRAEPCQQAVPTCQAVSWQQGCSGCLQPPPEACSGPRGLLGRQRCPGGRLRGQAGPGHCSEGEPPVSMLRSR